MGMVSSWGAIEIYNNIRKRGEKEFQVDFEKNEQK